MTSGITIEYSAIHVRRLGELPEVINPQRKQQATENFRFFCEAYFPLTFHLAWSPDHLKVIAKIEQAVLHGTGLEGSIYAGLETLTGELLGREWKRDDGAALRIERCLIDANWGHSTDVVYQFCRQSAHSAVLMP